MFEVVNIYDSELSIIIRVYVKRKKWSIRATDGFFIELVKVGDESTILYYFELFIFAVSLFFGLIQRDRTGRLRSFVVIHCQELFQTLSPVIHCCDDMHGRPVHSSMW